MKITKTFNTSRQARTAFQKIQLCGITNEQGTACTVKYATFVFIEEEDAIIAQSDFYSESTLERAINEPDIL